MANLSAVIETQEHRWMRAWLARDARTLKSLTASNFLMLFASKPPVILDTASWIEAATSRYLCTAYRFGDIHVRSVGGLALFATRVELEATMDGKDWSGRFYVTDLWRKGKVRRNWRMVERIVSRSEDKSEVPAGIRSLQLWR
jgi:hypothetical protein